MYISFVHSNGNHYRLPVSQVVVYDAGGQPVALSYEHAGVIVHTNASESDWLPTTDMLKIKQIDTKDDV